MRTNVVTRYLIDQLNHAAWLLDAAARKKKSDDLHDFRVALRRVRSLIKLYLKASVVFPKELKATVQATNPIRELDVLIESLKKKKYPGTVKRLARMRRKRARRLFTDEFLRETLNSLHCFRDTLSHTHPAIAQDRLRQIVEESYLSCRERYGAINDNTTKKELHSLRVAFKNTRYGLEFLQASGLRDEHAKINECKSFQNTLGAVQDGYNQVSWLKKLLRKHPCAETRKLLKRRKKKVKKLKAASRSAQSCAL